MLRKPDITGWSRRHPFLFFTLLLPALLFLLFFAFFFLGLLVYLWEAPGVIAGGVRYLLFFLLIGFVVGFVTVKLIKWRVRQLAQQRLAFEVTEARGLMEGLFPKEGTFKRSGIHLAYRRKQATTVSGDFYNFVSRGDGSLGIYFVDVEGHGLRASQQARSLYQVVSDREWGTGDARMELEKADELVRRGAIFQKEEVALCMNFTEIDPEKMEVRCANAGMPFPLLFRWGQAKPEFLQAAGVYVGAGYSRYPVKPEKAVAQVEDGDLLVIASDGILEARDSRGRTFGQKGITAAVFRTRFQPPEEIADEILRAVEKHTGKERPEDDQTLVVVLIGEPEKGPRLVGETLEAKDGVFSLMNAGDTGSAVHHQLRRQLIAWVQNQGLEERRAYQVWSATWEAIRNAIKYGSERGDVIHVRLIPPGEDGLLGVEVSQPIHWEDWDESLGTRRKKELQETDEILLGGTVTMLWLTDEIQVAVLGRRITMRFSPEVVPERKVSFKLDTASVPA